MIPDNNIGRYIADTLASVPKMSPAAFDKVFNEDSGTGFLCTVSGLMCLLLFDRLSEVSAVAAHRITMH